MDKGGTRLVHHVSALLAQNILTHAPSTCFSLPFGHLVPLQDRRKRKPFFISLKIIIITGAMLAHQYFLSFNDFREGIKTANSKGNFFFLHIELKVLKKFAFPMLGSVRSFLDSNPLCHTRARRVMFITSESLNQRMKDISVT